MSGTGKSRAAVAVVQMDCKTLDKSANLQKVREMLKVAGGGERALDMVVFAEGFSTGFSLGEEFYSVGEPIPGPTTEAMGEMARWLGAYMVVPLVEIGPGRDHQQFAVLLIARCGVGRHRKMHLPSFGISGQKRFFTRATVIRFETDFGKLGITIC